MDHTPPKPESLPLYQAGTVELHARIDRITFTNEQTGYTVAKARVSGYRDLITIVGNLLALTPGEQLHITGIWETHPKFGLQFRVLEHQTVLPESARGIERYLASGPIKGIGPVMASRIVRKFGKKTLDVIDRDTKRLSEVEGIGRKRVEMIKSAWDEQKEIRAILVFLQEYGIGLTHATKIFRRYGQRAIGVISRNPYQLATDIFGIGFQTADRIAKRLGFEDNAPVRIGAGILYVLDQLCSEGHVYYPYEPLVEKCREALGVERELVTQALGELSLAEKVVIEDLNQDLEAFEPNQKAVYLVPFHVAETGIAKYIQNLTASDRGVRKPQPDRAVRWVQQRIRLELAGLQVEAVKRAITDKVLVITGGPGTGKTTVIHAVIRIYRRMDAEVELAAPTGRASKRMSEATGHPARTIHRMLEYNWERGGFQRHERRPLDADVIILDEASMIDTMLMYHFLKAVRPDVTLILVGDAYQLPSVGPGNVLRDIIHSGATGVVELNEVFRQARESSIVMNAHRINRGNLPDREEGERYEDFYFIEQEDPDQTVQVIRELITQRIPRRFQLDPKTDIQLLTPMHKGPAGTINLNRVLQEALNPSAAALAKGERSFRLGDKVMQVRNNYEKEVFNGDIGLVQALDAEKQEMVVDFDGHPVGYEYPELDEIVLAYAISVHKSQGSEYPSVVLTLLPQHYMLLQRNLIYTAVTRARRLLVVVGSKKALAMGIKNSRPSRRFTNLAERLRN